MALRKFSNSDYEMKEALYKMRVVNMSRLFEDIKIFLTQLPKNWRQQVKIASQ